MRSIARSAPSATRLGALTASLFALSSLAACSDATRPTGSGGEDSAAGLETAGIAPPALIAHAGGAVLRTRYTNSREALDSAYANGFRLIELDLDWTTDGHLVLLHGWRRVMRQLFDASEQPRSLAEFEALEMKNGLTQMTFEDLLEWLQEHTDCFIVTDIKARNIDGLQHIRRHAGPLADRFIPQIYSQSEYAAARQLGFRDIILTLYADPGVSDESVLSFASTHALLAVTIPKARVRDAASSLAHDLSERGVFTYTHTVNREANLGQYSTAGIRGFYTDVLVPEETQRLRAN